MCRRVLRMRDDHVYDLSDHDGDRTQLSPPITGHVRHAALGQYSTPSLPTLSSIDVKMFLTFLFLSRF